jgi:uncharacterized protein (DUF736 family)
MSTKRIGCLWKAKEGSKAKLTGIIELLGEELPIGIFTNEKKDKPNQPDYNIVRFIQDDKQAEQTGQQEPPF